MFDKYKGDSPAEQEKHEQHMKIMRAQELRRAKVHAEWKERFDKAQAYSIRETLDDEGDILWTVKGPDVAFASHSIDSVKAFLKREGVEYRSVKHEAHVWPGSPGPHDGDA